MRLNSIPVITVHELYKEAWHCTQIVLTMQIKSSCRPKRKQQSLVKNGTTMSHKIYHIEHHNEQVLNNQTLQSDVDRVERFRLTLRFFDVSTAS